eukprot:48223-Prorocentrum_minimum.AAC.2
MRTRIDPAGVPGVPCEKQEPDSQRARVIIARNHTQRHSPRTVTQYSSRSTVVTVHRHAPGGKVWSAPPPASGSSCARLPRSACSPRRRYIYQPESSGSQSQYRDGNIPDT